MASAPTASGEDSLIARYFRPIATDPGAFNLDDDAAAIKPSGDDIVVTTDAIVEGVHFLADDPPDTIGARRLEPDALSGGDGGHARSSTIAAPTPPAAHTDTNPSGAD